MPSYVLGSHEGALFDVVGNRGGTTDAITHVGLLATPSAVTAGLKVPVLDMGPSLRIDPPGQLDAHVSGTLSLTRDEVEALNEWIAEVRTLVSQCRYLACPAAQQERDALSKRVKGWRFSCAGFVVTAYKQAGIQLVIEESDLPLLEKGMVIPVWSHIVSGRAPALVSPLLARLGLKGDGPWHVLVPGYILHALNQPRERLPYLPKSADINFP